MLIGYNRKKGGDLMKVYVMMADGFEEIEALAVVDVLRRGGVETIMVSVKNDKVVLSARDIPVVADTTIDKIEVAADDMIVLPGGGKGVEGLYASELLKKLLTVHNDRKGNIAAICAGPTIPGRMGLLKGIKATCYPGCEDDLEGSVISHDDVVADQNFITSRGPGTAFEFSFELLEKIKGSEVKNKVSKGMLCS
jgi:4-methyl-5(b-hydroxyethyl)-thiazole monophosphate biosynthesis